LKLIFFVSSFDLPSCNLLLIAIILFFGQKSVSIGSAPACHKAGQSNIVLNRIARKCNVGFENGVRL